MFLLNLSEGTDSDIQPWLAVLFTENSKRHFCSATLINSRFLVTAYHCLIEQTNQTLRILLGKIKKSVHFLIFIIELQRHFEHP